MIEGEKITTIVFFNILTLIDLLWKDMNCPYYRLK